MSERQESKLKRNLTFSNLMAIAIGQIIGAGIMTMTGTAIGMTGTGVALAFMISPFLTLVTDFPMAIMGGTVPVTGGPYKYISRLIGKKTGFLYIVLFIITSSTLSLYALSFASYVVSIFSGLNPIFVAVVILTVLFVVNVVGTKSAAITNTIVCFVMIGAILAFAAFGLPKADFAYIFAPANLFYKGPMNFMSALALLSFATGGASVIAQLGGEAKRPGRDIPMVMVVSTVFVGFLYMAMAMVASGVLPIETVADQNLSLVALEILPKPVYYVFVVGAALGATASTLNAQLSWVTKPIMVACEDGMLPKSLASVNSKGVPWKILTIFYVLGIFPIVMGFDLSFISKLSTSISLITKVLTVIALYWLASKYPEKVRQSTMKLPVSLYKPWAITAAVVAIILASSLLMSMSLTSVLLLAAVLVVAVIYSLVGLKNVTIPDDLDVDYIGNSQEEKS